MTRETAQKLLNNIPLLEAFIKQQPIQIKTIKGEWVDLPERDNLIIEAGCFEFRIKPREPREVWIKFRTNNGPYVIEEPPHKLASDADQFIRFAEILTDETP